MQYIYLLTVFVCMLTQSRSTASLNSSDQNDEDKKPDKRHTFGHEIHEDLNEHDGFQQTTSPDHTGFLEDHALQNHHEDLHHQKEHKTVTIIEKVPAPYLVHVEKKVAVPVDRPYPVPVPKPYPVHIEKHVAVPVKVAVPVPAPYPVEKRVPYPVTVHVEKPYTVHVPKPYPVYVDKPYPVTIVKKFPVKVPVDRPYPVHVPVEIPAKKQTPVEIPFKKHSPVGHAQSYSLQVRDHAHIQEHHVTHAIKENKKEDGKAVKDLEGYSFNF